MHTTRRNATYYFRRKIPLDLVAAYQGKREATFSLHTKDRAEAERLARKAAVALDDEWMKVRAAKPKEPAAWPTDYDFVEVAGKLYAKPPPKGGWPQPEPDARTLAEVAQAEYEHELGAAEDEREWRTAEADADKVIAALRLKGLTLYPTSTHDSAPPMPPASPTPIAASKSETLEDLIPHWKRERKPTAKTIATCERAVVGFQNLHREPPVHRITRRMVVAFRDKLLGDGLAIGTVNTQLSYIRALLGIALDRGLIEVNHAADSTLKEDKRAVDARLPYSPAQAAKVMALTEQFKDTAPARYWLPRLGRWTGARLNELHQLRTSDLVERDGIKGLRITDEGEYVEGVPMKLKNSGSRRWVPLHPAVLAFWNWATAQPAGPLFPARPNKFGVVSDAYSKAYGRMLRRVAGIEDKRITFHSWRHLFADKCRAAGLQDSIRYALMGHSEGGSAGGYGSGQLPPRVLAEAVSALGSTM